MGINNVNRWITGFIMAFALLTTAPTSYAQLPTATSASNLSTIQNNLSNNNATQAATQTITQGLSSGSLSPDLATALSNIPNLGNISNPTQLIQQVTNQAITSSLQQILQNTGGAQQALNTISQVSSIASAQGAIQQIGAQAVAQAITQQLQQVAPQLAQGLASAFGGAQGLTNALGGGIASAANAAAAASNTIANGQDANGNCSGGCPDCANCPKNINTNHQRIRSHVISEFEQHRNWLVTSYFLDTIAPAMMLMTEQLVTTGMHQVKIIGGFFDAKHQLETKRLFQKMTATAHKDYHPSQSMCKIGTNMRSLASSEKRTSLIHESLAQGMMQRQLLSGENLSGSGGQISDRKSRGDLLREKFCNKKDAGTDEDGNTALDTLCTNNSSDQMNMDIDFTNAVENNLTLKLDYTDEGNGPATNHEENIFALGANLFGNEVLPYISANKLKNDASVYDYLDLRSIAAKRSVAQNSYTAITAMRSESDGEAAPFLKAILTESGIEPDEIEKRLGEKPSYFAQMEVLTKDIYQNPTFYANLYDKPANIERKSAALLAIEIMQDRDLYNSLIRSEAVLATLLEVMLSGEHDRITDALNEIRLEGKPFLKNDGGS